MAVYSDTLYLAVTGPGSTINLTTVPNGQTWIIKHVLIAVALTTPPATAVSLQVTRGASVVLITAGSLSNLAIFEREQLFGVVKQGDALRVNLDQPVNFADIFISGSRLQGVAS